MMKYKLVIAGKEYVLSETDRNIDVIQQIHSGQFPGLCTVDSVRGPIAVNLSEYVTFVVEGDEFRGDVGKPRAVIIG